MGRVRPQECPPESMTASEAECWMTAWAIAMVGCHRLPKPGLFHSPLYFSSVPKSLVHCLLHTPDAR